MPLMRSVGFSGMMDEAVIPWGLDETPPSTLRSGFGWSVNGGAGAVFPGVLLLVRYSLMSLNLPLTEMSG